MAWQSEARLSKEKWFEQFVSTVLETPFPKLPPKVQKIGNTTVSWFESDPHVAVILSKTGNADERSFAEWVVKHQLEEAGYRRAQFTFDHTEKTSSWDDIMDKAKRLIDSGNVQVIRNGYNNIVGQVQGDHGIYDTEISRDDPNSRAITQWTCTCDWDQYAFQRTRKWKYLEGRPCAHCLALYWQAQSMPLDEDSAPVGQGQLFDPGTSPQGGQSGPMTAPAAPQSQQLQIPGVTPGMAQGTAPVPPGQIPGQPAPDLLPPFPQAEKPPPPVSVPGGKLPSPLNPIQYPGGTFSSWKLGIQNNWGFESSWSFDKLGAIEDLIYDQSQWGNLQVRLNKSHYGVMQGKSEEHGAGQYKEIPANSIGTLMEVVDDLGGQANVIFAGPQATAGPLEPYFIQSWVPINDLTARPDLLPPGPFIKRRAAWNFDA